MHVPIRFHGVGISNIKLLLPSTPEKFMFSLLCVCMSVWCKMTAKVVHGFGTNFHGR